MNRLWISVLLGLSAAVAARAGAPPAPTRTAADNAEPSGGFLSGLLPKAFQKNPKLDFNIITEMSAEGRRMARPTTQKPAFYISQSGGMRNVGLSPEESLKGPTEENLQRMMERALGENHYLSSSGPAQPPTIVIIYQFGSHSFQPPASVGAAPAADGEAADPAGSGDVPVPEIVIRKALLDKAQLLGGAKFLKEVSEAMAEVDRIAGMERSHVTVAGGEDFGSVASMMRDPFDVLRNKGPDYERLVDELFSSSYFVVATAYDYAALVRKERKLLWRTKMTVNSLGVNMVESLPPLIASAAPYLGIETRDPVVISKRVMRGGNVEIGEAKVVEADATLPKKSPDPKKK